MKEQIQTTAAQSATESVADRLRKIKRGAEPIPGHLPLVGVGIPGPLEIYKTEEELRAGESNHGHAYTEEDLLKLKDMGLNAMMTDFYVKADLQGSAGMIPTVKTDLTNIKTSFENGRKAGMRIIPGVTLTDRALIGLTPPSPSESEANLKLKERTSWMRLVDEQSNAKGCPAWFLSSLTSASELGNLANRCNDIYLKDVWKKPILFRLQPSDATVKELTGEYSFAGDAFARYREKLDNECPPSVWWVTDRAFSSGYSDAAVLPRPDYLKALKDVMDHIRPKTLDLIPRHNSMWATVHCSFNVPDEHLGKEEKDIPQEYLDLMKLRMGLEARCALALGAKGLVFDRLCGADPIKEWCPVKQWVKNITPGEKNPGNTVWEEVDNPLANHVTALTGQIQKLADAFIGTELAETCVVSTYSLLRSYFGNFSSKFGTLTKIELTGGTPHLLLSRFVNRLGNKEYVVIVNLNPVESSSLNVTFDKEMRNLNPGQLMSVTPVLPPSIRPTAETDANVAQVKEDAPSADGIVNPSFGTEKSTGREFALKIGAGDWRIFSRSRALSEFGIKE